MTSIGGGAFYECSSLTSIISKITDPFSLGYNAFGNISKYATLTIPQGTKGLYENAGWTQFFSKVVESSIVEPTYQTIYVNGVTFKMIDIMGGTFLMGAQFNNRNGDNYDADADMSLYKESPVHEVTLSNYSIGETEVTQELWKAVMGTNPSMTATGNKKPVEYVTYNECQTFIQTLNQLTGKNFRLPTEAEWEFAARGGTQSNHYKWAGTSSATNVKDYVWYAGGSTPGYANGTTHDVKNKQPNELGLYDMSGNVWEWCADWYDPDYYSTSPQNDPKGPAMGNYHTVRGGSWNTNAKYCRVSTRNAKDEYYRDKEIGLRLALGESSTTTTYTLSISATGNGAAMYDINYLRNSSWSFTVSEGTNATITFTPDYGYRIKTVKVNGSTVSVNSNNEYTVSNIYRNTTVEVEFEAVSPTTYTLSITASGYGSASYNGTTVRGRTNSFTLNEGTNATITFTPDNGYRIKSVMVNNLTVSVSNNQYTVSNISRNTTVSVEFEAIPPTTYTLSITATGYGSASYNGTTVRGRTTSFTVNEGTNAMITFSSDAGYRIKTVKVNDAAVTVSNNQYTVSNISRNTTVSVEFEGAISEMAVNGVSYRVASLESKTINVTSGNYGEVLRVPATVSYEGLTFMVAGIESGALASATNLAAVVWEPATQFTERVSNPNLLLYVSRADYAPAGIQNVVVNGTAERIVLTEASNGNDFYCPEEFTARSISLTHHYSMTSGLESCQGWETIVLPFDVQRISHESKGAMVPFAAWQQTDEEKPFWLYALGSGGWEAAATIRAYEPYIISMPNNDRYRDVYRVNGNVTFAAENVRVKKTDVAAAVSGGGKTLVPNFRSQSASSEVFALNVVNDYNSETAGAAAGSQFVRQLRPVHPFEAYLIANNMTRGDVIPVFEEYSTTNVVDNEIMRNVENEEWYSVDGRKLEGKPTRKGVYIKNRKTVVVK